MFMTLALARAFMKENVVTQDMMDLCDVEEAVEHASVHKHWRMHSLALRHFHTVFSQVAMGIW